MLQGCSLNSKDFVAHFHAEGKRQYSLQQTLTDLRNNLENNIKSPTNKSAMVKFYDSDYTLVPFDIGTINYNKKRIKLEYAKAKELEQQVIDCNNIFTNSGKIKPGRECAINFNREALANI